MFLWGADPVNQTSGRVLPGLTVAKHLELVFPACRGVGGGTLLGASVLGESLGALSRAERRRLEDADISLDD